MQANRMCTASHSSPPTHFSLSPIACLKCTPPSIAHSHTPRTCTHSRAVALRSVSAQHRKSLLDMEIDYYCEQEERMVIQVELRMVQGTEDPALGKCPRDNKHLILCLREGLEPRLVVRTPMKVNQGAAASIGYDIKGKFSGGSPRQHAPHGMDAIASPIALAAANVRTILAKAGREKDAEVAKRVQINTLTHPAYTSMPRPPPFPPLVSQSAQTKVVEDAVAKLVEKRESTRDTVVLDMETQANMEAARAKESQLALKHKRVDLTDKKTPNKPATKTLPSQVSNRIVTRTPIAYLQSHPFQSQSLQSCV